MQVTIEFVGNDIGEKEENWHGIVRVSHGLFTDRWAGTTPTCTSFWHAVMKCNEVIMAERLADDPKKVI